MIVICWWQLPVYAARAIREFVQQSGENVVVLRVPYSRFKIKGAEAQTDCPVIDVEADTKKSIREVCGEMPDIIVCGGWACRCFTRWANEVRKAGGKTILATDEAFTSKSLKQVVRKWRFKLFLNRLYDKLFLCGAGGKKLFEEWYGIHPQKVFYGVYGSDPLLFHNGPELASRPKRFLYVGHLDANKNVLRMCDAFLAIYQRYPEWELEICGSGELEAQIPRGPGIVFTGFIQAEDLGEKYRSARCLILGSFSEKWGVVVHEAAASGCMLIMSQNVGSNLDFVRSENAYSFNPSDTNALTDCMERIILKSDAELKVAQATSVALAQHFSPKVFAKNLMKAVAELRKK